MSTVRIRGKQIPLDLVSRNSYQLIQQGLASIVRVAMSDDLPLALRAGQWLVEYGEGVLREKRVHPVEQRKRELTSREQIIAELRGLYAKALGPAPLVVEAQAEAVPSSKDQPASTERS